MAIKYDIPLYPHSRAEAIRLGQLDEWRDSYRANMDCAKAIDAATREDWMGVRLKKDCAQKVLNDYGFKRVNYVLANTIQKADWDGRYGASNKEWAKRIFVPPDETNGYFALNAHPCIIENFVNQTRARPRKLHIFRFRRARERRKLTRSAARPLSSARLRARRSRHVAPLPFAFSRRIFRARRGDEDKFDVENRHRPAAVRRHARQPSEAVVERKGGTAE